MTAYSYHQTYLLDLERARYGAVPAYFNKIIEGLEASRDSDYLQHEIAFHLHAITSTHTTQLTSVITSIIGNWEQPQQELLTVYMIMVNTPLFTQRVAATVLQKMVQHNTTVPDSYNSSLFVTLVHMCNLHLGQTSFSMKALMPYIPQLGLPYYVVDYVDILRDRSSKQNAVVHEQISKCQHLAYQEHNRFKTLDAFLSMCITGVDFKNTGAMENDDLALRLAPSIVARCFKRSEHLGAHILDTFPFHFPHRKIKWRFVNDFPPSLQETAAYLDNPASTTMLLEHAQVIPPFVPPAGRKITRQVNLSPIFTPTSTPHPTAPSPSASAVSAASVPSTSKRKQISPPSTLIPKDTQYHLIRPSQPLNLTFPSLTSTSSPCLPPLHDSAPPPIQPPVTHVVSPSPSTSTRKRHHSTETHASTLSVSSSSTTAEPYIRYRNFASVDEGFNLIPIIISGLLSNNGETVRQSFDMLSPQHRQLLRVQLELATSVLADTLEMDQTSQR